MTDIGTLNHIFDISLFIALIGYTVRIGRPSVRAFHKLKERAEEDIQSLLNHFRLTISEAGKSLEAKQREISMLLVEVEGCEQRLKQLLDRSQHERSISTPINDSSFNSETKDQPTQEPNQNLKPSTSKLESFETSTKLTEPETFREVWTPKRRLEEVVSASRRNSSTGNRTVTPLSQSAQPQKINMTRPPLPENSLQDRHFQQKQRHTNSPLEGLVETAYDNTKITEGVIQRFIEPPEVIKEDSIGSKALSSFSTTLMHEEIVFKDDDNRAQAHMSELEATRLVEETINSATSYDQRLGVLGAMRRQSRTL